MSLDHYDRLHAARQALEQLLATSKHPARHSWHEATRESDATVLAFDVTLKPDGTRLEELVGVAIHDSTSLFLATRSGSDWHLTSEQAETKTES